MLRRFRLTPVRRFGDSREVYTRDPIAIFIYRKAKCMSEVAMSDIATCLVCRELMELMS